jgi:acyl dehydratase
MTCDLPTSPQAALIYRLSGDLNPLHAAPDIARKAGYERPILHGLATFGNAAHAILSRAADYRPTALKAISGRFSAPIFPGDTIRTEIWIDGREVSFQCSVPGRAGLVLSGGHAVLSGD